MRIKVLLENGIIMRVFWILNSEKKSKDLYIFKLWYM